MAKNRTPEMDRINAKRYGKGKARRTTPMGEAWLRLIRNKVAIFGLVILVLFIIMAIFATYISPYPYDEANIREKFMSPCWEHPFGTDQLGRDLLSRCVYGTRITMPIAILSVTAAVLFGGFIGIISAYFGGTVDNFLMRFIDIWGSIPGIMLAIAVVACFGNSSACIVMGLALGAVPNMARTFRGAIFTVVDNDYVESSRAMGASHFRIMFRHLLPNAVGPVILAIVGLLGVEVLCVSALSFVGVGVEPGTPEWGALLSAGRQYLTTNVYLCFFPGVMIMLAVLGFNLLGDGLRDALDPRLK